jgi:hypothetical protein
MLEKMQQAFGGGRPTPPQQPQMQQKTIKGEVKIKYMEEKDIEALEDRVNNFIEEIKENFKQVKVTQFPMPSVVHMERKEKGTMLAIITYFKPIE